MCVHICLYVSIHTRVRMFGFLHLYISNGMCVVQVVPTCPFITCVCEGRCVCGLVCVRYIIFPCLYLYLRLHLWVSKYVVGVCQY